MILGDVLDQIKMVEQITTKIDKFNERVETIFGRVTNRLDRFDFYVYELSFNLNAKYNGIIGLEDSPHKLLINFEKEIDVALDQLNAHIEKYHPRLWTNR